MRMRHESWIGIGLMLIFSGCVTVAVAIPQPAEHQINNSRIYTDGPDTIWPRVMAYFTTQNYLIRTVEKDSGIVYAEKLGVKEAGYADCGKKRSMDTVVEQTVGFNVFVEKQASGGSKVTVTADFKERRRNGWDGSYYTMNCSSLGVLEGKILDALQADGPVAISN